MNNYSKEELNDLKNIIANLNDFKIEHFFWNNIHIILSQFQKPKKVKRELNKLKNIDRNRIFKNKHYPTLFYKILYVYSLENLIPYLNTEFEPIVYWRYSLKH
jgi:hypothetical protein